MKPNSSWILMTLLIISGCSEPIPPTVTPTDSHGGGAVESAVNSTGSTGEDNGGIFFQDVTDESGVSFTNRNGEEAGHFSIVESLGAGVGIIDVDRDGFDDLMLPGGGTLDDDARPRGLPTGLFRNAGGWKFRDVADASGINNPRYYSHGIASADFDNDGFCDALVTGYGGLQLFHNLGDGTFEEISIASGLADTLWSSSAAWGDVTGDGILDLYVAHYVNWTPENHPFCAGPEESTREVCPPRQFEPLPDTLYIGSSDGTFNAASDEFGLTDSGKGLGVLIADLNGDHRPDIYVTNDTVPNVLYRNVAGRSLEDLSLMSGTSLSDRGVPDGSMGVHLLDFDQNGHFDIWVANYERESCAVYQGHGDMLFRHVSQRTGVTAVGAKYVGWGTICFDADHDGDEDVFVANGHVIRYPRSAPLRQTPLFFENQNGTRFRDVAATAGKYMSQPHMGRGAAPSDLDNDGDIDVVAMHTGEPVSLLKNSCHRGSFLQLELIGRDSTRDAIGVVVSVTVEKRKILRQWIGGGSYASTGTRRLHFAFEGPKPQTIDDIEIRWPSGTVQQVSGVTPDTLISIVESRSRFFKTQE